MSRVVEFIAHHWVLVTLFFLAVIWLFIEESRSQGVMGGSRLTPQQTTTMINRENAVLLDLREVNAFKAGHIINSMNIPVSMIEQKINKIERYKDNPLILVCVNGQQSLKMMAKLKKSGFNKVFILAGGVGAWKQANLPVVKD